MYISIIFKLKLCIYLIMEQSNNELNKSNQINESNTINESNEKKINLNTRLASECLH